MLARGGQEQQGSDSAQPRRSHEYPQPFWTYVKNLLGKDREEALICARKDADDIRGPDAAEDDRRLPYIPETFLNLAQDILLSLHRCSLRQMNKQHFQAGEEEADAVEQETTSRANPENQDPANRGPHDSSKVKPDRKKRHRVHELLAWNKLVQKRLGGGRIDAPNHARNDLQGKDMPKLQHPPEVQKHKDKDGYRREKLDQGQQAKAIVAVCQNASQQSENQARSRLAKTQDTQGHRRAGDLVGDPVERGLPNELACGGKQVGRPIEGVVSMQKRAKDANQLPPLLKASIMPTHTLYLVLLLVKRDRPSPTGLQIGERRLEIPSVGRTGG